MLRSMMTMFSGRDRASHRNRRAELGFLALDERKVPSGVAAGVGNLAGQAPHIFYFHPTPLIPTIGNLIGNGMGGPYLNIHNLQTGLVQVIYD